MVDGLETPDCAFYLSEKSLYDSVTIGTTVTGYPGSGLSLPGHIGRTYHRRPLGSLLDPMLVRLQPIQPRHSLPRESPYLPGNGFHNWTHIHRYRSHRHGLFRQRTKRRSPAECSAAGPRLIFGNSVTSSWCATPFA